MVGSPMARKTRSTPLIGEPPYPIHLERVPEDQRDLPVGFAPSGRLVSLRDLARGDEDAQGVPDPADLPRKRLEELTIERLKMQPNFQVVVLGKGTVDQERAIDEVRRQTPLGKTLVDIERYFIQYIVSTAQRAD